MEIKFIATYSVVIIRFKTIDYFVVQLSIYLLDMKTKFRYLS